MPSEVRSATTTAPSSPRRDRRQDRATDRRPIADVIAHHHVDHAQRHHDGQAAGGAHRHRPDRRQGRGRREAVERAGASAGEKSIRRRRCCSTGLLNERLPLLAHSRPRRMRRHVRSWRKPTPHSRRIRWSTDRTLLSSRLFSATWDRMSSANCLVCSGRTLAALACCCAV